MDDRTPVTDRLRQVASRFEAGVSHGRAEQLAARAVARARHIPGRSHRVAAVVVGSAFTLVVLSAVAIAADSAVPGDILYPVDRAVEALGLDRERLEERLEEAIVLADRGDRDRMVLLAREVLDEVNRTGVVVSRPSASSTEPTGDLALAVEAAPEDSERSQTAASVVAEQQVPSSESSAVLASETDPMMVIRLQAENLLRTVRLAKEDPASVDAVGSAAGSLADALDAAVSTSTTTTSSTTTTTVTSTTTSTAVAEATTTTIDPSSSTTSTTVAGEGGGDDGSEPGDGDGSGGGGDQPPITLPQP
jgi:hypothetical protein